MRMKTLGKLAVAAFVIAITVGSAMTLRASVTQFVPCGAALKCITVNAGGGARVPCRLGYNGQVVVRTRGECCCSPGGNFNLVALY